MGWDGGNKPKETIINQSGGCMCIVWGATGRREEARLITQQEHLCLLLFWGLFVSIFRLLKTPQFNGISAIRVQNSSIAVITFETIIIQSWCLDTMILYMFPLGTKDHTILKTVNPILAQDLLNQFSWAVKVKGSNCQKLPMLYILYGMLRDMLIIAIINGLQLIKRIWLRSCTWKASNFFL